MFRVELALSRGNGGGEGLARTPLGGRAGAGLLHHLVDLFEGKALCLRDKEIRVYEGAGAETAPDEEDGGTKVSAVGVDHVGGDDGDDGIPEPVGGSGKTNTTGTDWEWENFHQ